MGSLVGYFGNISDFDQSDENKYFVVKNSTKFSMQNISDIYYDKSTDVFQVGISIRSEDYKSQFSGGIYLGVDLNKLLTHYKLP
ncbi:MAG: hypothetical protein GY909_19295 [Oligoflexia bacterium]|nr:hypothetical protein [Oligoflexia bacterium]